MHDIYYPKTRTAMKSLRTPCNYLVNEWHDRLRWEGETLQRRSGFKVLSRAVSQEPHKDRLSGLPDIPVRSSES